MLDLASQLAEVCREAFVHEGLDPKWGEVKRSDRPELADFQCNGCMGAARQAGLNPRQLAHTIAPHLAAHAMIDRVDVAGPGFLNMTITSAALSRHAEAIASDDKAGGLSVDPTETLVIDFGGPNVAKPMHVGHLRSAVIGDTLVRLMRFVGHRVIGDVHLGDWGLQMGLLIIAVQDEQPGLVYFAEDAAAPFPEVSPVTMEDLSRLYPMASARSKSDEAYAERARHAVAQMQAGRAGYRALLQHFIQVSVAALKTDYAFLDVDFDLWKGESDVDHLIAPMVSDLKSRGLVYLDAGAWIMDIARDTDTKDMPPFMLVNSRGATGYHATDLATLADRAETLQPDRVIYVVDQRQAFHFEQVFRASEKTGLFTSDRLEHIGFGTVNGSDGKPFKTREGGTLRLSDLNALALDEAKRKIAQTGLSQDVSAQAGDGIAQLVARAALRFADLQNQRTTNYVFDLDRFTRFEGKTGPYLLYAAVRLKALLRRADVEGLAPGGVRIETEEERKLTLALDGFALALRLAHDKRMPHYVCEHVYGLAQAFSTFYAACPIFKTDIHTTVRASRLTLCKGVLHQLVTGLNILGISAPDRM